MKSSNKYNKILTHRKLLNLERDANMKNLRDMTKLSYVKCVKSVQVSSNTFFKKQIGRNDYKEDR